MARLRNKLIAQSEAQNHRCCYCAKICWIWGYDRKGRSQDQATFEHIVPQSNYGSNSRENCAMACMDCNTSRGSQDAMEFFYMRCDEKTWNEFKERVRKERNRRKRIRETRRKKMLEGENNS